MTCKKENGIGNGDCPCEDLWYKNPSALFQNFTLRTDDICQSNNLNAVSRAFFIATVVGILFMVIGYPELFAVAILAVIVLHARWLFAKPTMYSDKEGFEASVQSHTLPTSAFPDVIGVSSSEYTTPNAKNPFMNVLLDEIQYNPTRAAAASVSDPTVSTTLDDYFRVQWVSDPTDVFGKSQSQRQFYTMPSTSIPNDQASYQNWLYRIPGKTCKEGNRDACVPGTNGGSVPWLSFPN